jgi:phenylacetate-CoA ligase
VAPHFQLELSKRGRMDYLTVRAEARPDAASDARARTEAVASIAHAVKDGVGVSVEVVIEDPETLERSSGKLQRVKDLRA